MRWNSAKKSLEVITTLYDNGGKILVKCLVCLILNTWSWAEKRWTIYISLFA